MPAWVRARSPKPWSTPSPVHSSAASQTRIGSCSSWTWGTTRTEPGDQLLLVGLDPQREPDQLGQVALRLGVVAPQPALEPLVERRREEPRATRAGDGRAARQRVDHGGHDVADQPYGVGVVTGQPARLVVVGRRGAGRHRPSPGSKDPAATSRIPSSAAPAISRTLAWASSRAGARVSTGSAPRIGSVTVCRPSVNSTTLSRGASAAVNTAGPVTGTKLTQQAPLGRTGGWRGP